jgi:hypothetical protein
MPSFSPLLSVFEITDMLPRGGKRDGAKKKAAKPFPRSRDACLRGPVDDAMECAAFLWMAVIPGLTFRPAIMPVSQAGNRRLLVAVLRDPIPCVFQKGKVFLMAGSLQTGGTQNGCVGV